MDSQVSTAASRSGSGWKVLTAVVFGVFMVILDSTVVNVAFKTLQEEYTANLNLTQWVLSVYTMALGIATPLSGFLGDRFGEKRVFIASIFLFGLSSLLCGLAPSLGLLILFRALQGAAGGVATPLGTSLLYKAFPPEDRGAAMGVFGIALVAAPALGPILGGWLVDLGHWRWIFYINVPHRARWAPCWAPSGCPPPRAPAPPGSTRWACSSPVRDWARSSTPPARPRTWAGRPPRWSGSS